MFTVETLERTNVDSVNIPLANIHPEEGTSMFSNTYLPVIRQPATRIATGALAALILAAFAQTSSASDAATRAGPDWSSRIGTGQPFVTGSERQQPRATSTAPHDASSAHWSARIGSGRAVVESGATPVASSIAGAPAPTHWSAYIGTGQASPAVNVGKLAERTEPAEARAIAEPRGEHPAVLVARSWSNRGIDPNTFIVLHPAGSNWTDTSLTATENATSDTAAQAVRTASASNK
jgi:hypothetical protein